MEQAKLFDIAVGIDGLVLTKLDADAKGGAALSATYVTKKPIHLRRDGSAWSVDPSWMLRRLFTTERPVDAATERRPRATEGGWQCGRRSAPRAKLSADRLVLGVLRAKVGARPCRCRVHRSFLLSNPLAGMQNCVRTLLKGVKDEAQRRQYLSMLREGLGRIGRTVGQLLNFAREAEPRLARVDLAPLLRRCLALVEHELAARRIAFFFFFLSSTRFSYVLLGPSLRVTPILTACSWGGFRTFQTVDPMHRVTIRSEIADPNDELHPGMLANFVIRVHDPVESIAVPANGVVLIAREPCGVRGPALAPGLVSPAQRSGRSTSGRRISIDWVCTWTVPSCSCSP